MRTFKYLQSTLAAAALALLAAAPAQAWEWGGWGKTVKGSGVVKTETRAVAGFTRVGVSIPANVEIIQGATEGVSIEGDDNIVPLIEAVVESGGLKIRFTDRNMNVRTKLLKVTVNAKALEGVAVAGSGDVHAARINAGSFKVSVAGSGDVSIDQLLADSVSVSVAGSGNFTAAGKVGSIETKISGSGDMKLGRLEADSVKVSVAGSGDATVWAKQKLTVTVAGSGDVKYYGDAQVTQAVAGSGSVKRLGASPGV